MTELFEIYQTNFTRIASKINNDFKHAHLLENNGTKEKLLKLIEDNINESKRMLKTMEVYVNMEKSLDGNLSMYLNTCFKCVEQFSLELKKEKNKFRNEIQKNHTINQRHNDISFNESIVSNSFEKLEQAKRFTYDMEYTGKDIIIELSEQRNKMNQMTNKIGHLNNLFDSKKHILSNSVKVKI